MIDSGKGKAIIVLSQSSQHEASTIAKSDADVEASNLVKVATMIQGIQYLDLAVDIKPRTTTPTEESTFEAMYIKVPFGQNTYINRSLLKAMGPAKAMYLFPNLPLEIRQKIFKYTVEGVTVQVKLTDNGHNWIGDAFPPPELLAASKEACQYIFHHQKEYTHVFERGATLYNPKLDELFVKLVSIVNAPTLAIAPKFSAGETMASISCLTFEICNLENSVQWINENLRGMINLKSLAIHAFIPISAPGQSEVSFYVVSEDVDRTRQEYDHVLESESGAKFVGFNAMTEINRRIVNQNERQGVFGLWMMLSRCLKNRTRFPTFPSTVLTALHWVDDN
jgi:hypothetical protein